MVLPSSKGIELRLRVNPRISSMETTVHCEPQRAPKVGLHRVWNPNIDFLHAAREAWRGHADDGKRGRAYMNHLTHDVRLAFKLGVPEFVAYNSDGASSGA